MASKVKAAEKRHMETSPTFWIAKERWPECWPDGAPHLLPELVLLDQLLEPLCQLHVLLAQLGVAFIVLFHLQLNVIQRHLEV